MSTISDRKVAVRVTNTTETTYLIKRNKKFAEFSTFTPEQADLIKPADMALLSMVLEGDAELTSHLNGLIRTNKPEHQNKN